MKKLLIIIGILIAIGIGIYFYMTSRLNYLPDWYKQEDFTNLEEPVSPNPAPTETPAAPEIIDETENLPSTEEKPVQPAPQLPQSSPSSKNGSSTQDRLTPESRKTVEEINRDLAQNKTARISEEELNRIVLLSITETMPRKNADFMKAVRSSIHPDKIDLEMIADINKIPWNDLPPKARLTKNLLDKLPSKSASELYMKVSGAPVVNGGQLSFDDNATVQLGKIAYPLKDFLAMPGVNQIIPAKISLQKAPFNNVRLEDGFLVLVNE